MKTNVLKKRSFWLTFSLIAMFMMFWSAGSFGKDNPVSLTMGTPPSSSGLYAYMIGVSQSVMNQYPHFRITAQETGGAAAQHKLLFKREIDFSIVTSVVADQQLKGYGAYEGNKDEGLRVLWWLSPHVHNYVVLKSSGITTASQLTGKKFNPGGQGTSAAKVTYHAFGELGIKPEFYVASQNDAANAVQNGWIVGLTKGGMPPDSFIQRVAAVADVKLIGYTSEQVEHLTNKFPYYMKYIIPAKSYSFQDQPVETIADSLGVGATTKLSEDIAYKIVMGMWRNKEKWIAAWAPGKKVNVPDMTAKSSYLLHAGAVKAWRELGYNIPDKIVPPEFKK